eukprot:3935443-Rhodomonas_salina.4
MSAIALRSILIRYRPMKHPILLRSDPVSSYASPTHDSLCSDSLVVMQVLPPLPSYELPTTCSAAIFGSKPDVFGGITQIIQPQSRAHFVNSPYSKTLHQIV